METKNPTLEGLTYIVKNYIFCEVKKGGNINTESRISNRQAYNKAISFELSLIESDQIKNIKSMGTGVDISPDGIGISTNHVLTKGDVLKLHIPDDIEKSTNTVFAEVVWSRPSNSHFRMGLRFLRRSYVIQK